MRKAGLKRYRNPSQSRQALEPLLRPVELHVLEIELGIARAEIVAAEIFLESDVIGAEVGKAPDGPHRAADMIGRLLPYPVPRQRRDMALQTFKLARPFGREKVAARRQYLSQFHECGVKLLQSQPQALGCGRIELSAISDRRRQQPGESDFGQDIANPETSQDRRNLRQALRSRMATRHSRRNRAAGSSAYNAKSFRWASNAQGPMLRSRRATVKFRRPAIIHLRLAVFKLERFRVVRGEPRTKAYKRAIS